MHRQSYFFWWLTLMIRDKVKKARMANGYTQEEMAVIFGVDRSTYTYYETGKCDIPVKALLAASSVFDIAVEWFLTPDDEKPATQAKPASTVLRSPNIFIPETLMGDFDQDEDFVESENSSSSLLSSEERIMLARYRIIKEAGRESEVDGYLKKLVDEEMSKM